MIGIIASKLIIVAMLGIVATCLGWMKVPVHWSFAVWFAVVVVLLMPPLISIPVAPPLAAQNDAGGLHMALETSGDSSRELAQRRHVKSPPTDGQDGSDVALLDGRLNFQGAEPRFFALLWMKITWVAFALWILGAVVVWIRQRRALAPLGRLVRAAERGPKALSQQYAVIAAKMHIRHAPRLVICNGVFSPFLWHAWLGASYIVLPEKLVDQLSAKSLAAILKHELCHYRRRDAARYLLEQVTVALWWWMPLSWMARRRLHELEEMCIDVEVVAGGCGASRDYAAALLCTEELLLPVGLRGIQAVPAFTKHEILKTRIESIMNCKMNAAELRSSQYIAAALGWLIVPLGLCTVGWATDVTAAEMESVPIPVADAPVAHAHSEEVGATTKTRPQESQSRTARQAAQNTVESAQGLQKITLTRRREAVYGRSAYSFRYRTQQRDAHRNNVDLVYSTRGMLRIDHHGGLDTGIYDLGERETLQISSEQLQGVDWEPRNLPPIEGHVYALAVKVRRHQMIALFRVTKVAEQSLEFVWNPADYPRWPIRVSSLGFNGESGMDGGRSGEGLGQSFKDRSRSGRSAERGTRGGGAGGKGGVVGGGAGGKGGVVGGGAGGKGGVVGGGAGGKGGVGGGGAGGKGGVGGGAAGGKGGTGGGGAGGKGGRGGRR